MKPTASLSIASCLLVALLSPHVQAQAPAPARVVTRDELRVCMNTEKELAGRREAIDKHTAEAAAEATGIRAEADEIAAERKMLEGDAARLARFNERTVKKHNARVQDANTKVVALRQELEGYNVTLSTFNEKCGGLAFNPDDKAAILQEQAEKK